MSSHAANPEFSRLLVVSEMPGGAEARAIEASPEERAVLAKRFDLISLDSLTAVLSLEEEAGGLVRLAGRFEARLVQTCGVTLAPVPGEVRGTLERLYAPAGLIPEALVEEEMDGEDLPDPIGADGTIDLGEAVAEQLGLGIDPFPRAPGAAFEGYSSGGDEAQRRDSPFAVLEKLREKKD